MVTTAAIALFRTMLVCGLLAFACSHWSSNTTKTAIVNLASSLLGVIAILIGFFATSVTLLLTSSDTFAMRRMKSAVQFVAVVEYHFISIFMGLIACILSLAVMAYTTDWTRPFSSVLYGIWLFASFVSIATMFQLVYALRLIILRTIPRPDLQPVPDDEVTS